MEPWSNRVVVNPSAGAAAFPAFDFGSEPRGQHVAGVLRDVDQGLMPPRIVVAERNEVSDALPAHVGQRHGRAGSLFAQVH